MIYLITVLKAKRVRSIEGLSRTRNARIALPEFIETEAWTNLLKALRGGRTSAVGEVTNRFGEDVDSVALDAVKKPSKEDTMRTFILDGCIFYI